MNSGVGIPSEITNKHCFGNCSFEITEWSGLMYIAGTPTTRTNERFNCVWSMNSVTRPRGRNVIS